MRSACLIFLLLVLGGCAETAELTEAAGTRARVVRVVDGDTLKVQIAGRRDTVRLLGIDTPETVRPGAPVECGGKAAARNLRRLVLTPSGRGRSVRLVADPTQARRDRFDRRLAYVDLLDGTDTGRAQVAAGWARVFVFGGVPFRRAAGYRDAERSAERSGRGIWSRC